MVDEIQSGFKQDAGIICRHMIERRYAVEGPLLLIIRMSGSLVNSQCVGQHPLIMEYQANRNHGS